MIAMTKNRIFKSLAGMAMLLAAAGAAAQSVPPRVTARISPDSIMIGDRFTLEIEVDKDVMQSISFPSLDRRTASAGGAGESPQPTDDSIECIEDLPADTVSVDGRRVRLRKRYVMAAFDEGNYSFGRAQVLYADKNIVDTLYADDSLRIAVATFQIDSTSHAIFDIKAQKTLPFRFGEISGYLLWLLLALAAVALVVWLAIRWLHSHGRRITDIFKPAPPLPPHVVAISALETLHNQKLWQNNRHKQYYSGLSDILRTYIAARWGVGAMEMTSDEIIEAMRSEELPDKARMDLTAILRDADLVKFAKATPDGEQNEADYLKAFYFVEETKLVVEEEEPEQPDPMQNQNA